MIIGLCFLAPMVDRSVWTFTAHKEDGNCSILVDQESIESASGSVVRAWIKYEFTKTFSGERMYDWMKCSPKKALSHTIVHKEFTCDARKGRLLELTEYYPDTVPYTEQGDTSWKDAVADSDDEILISSVCRELNR